MRPRCLECRGMSDTINSWADSDSGRISRLSFDLSTRRTRALVARSLCIDSWILDVQNHRSTGADSGPFAVGHHRAGGRMPVRIGAAPAVAGIFAQGDGASPVPHLLPAFQAAERLGGRAGAGGLQAAVPKRLRKLCPRVSGLLARRRDDGRPQGAPPAVGRRSQERAAVPPRSRVVHEAQAPEHRADL